MAKRKASSPLNHVNGGDDDEDQGTGGKGRRSLGSSSRVNPSTLSFNFAPTKPPPLPQQFNFSSPSMGGGGSSPLSSTPGKRRSSTSGLDSTVGEKMARVNEDFVGSLASTLAERPDALLFPLVESYVRHVHGILKPHLPPTLVQGLEKDKGFLGMAKFMEKCRNALGHARMMEGGSSSSSRNLQGSGGSYMGMGTPPSSKMSSPLLKTEKPLGVEVPRFSFGMPGIVNPLKTSQDKKDPLIIMGPSSSSSSLVPPTVTTTLSGSSSSYIIAPEKNTKGLMVTPGGGSGFSFANPSRPSTAATPAPDSSNPNPPGTFLSSIPSFNFNFGPPPPSAASSSSSKTEVTNQGQRGHGGDNAQNQEENEEDSEEPPKPEFKPVKEDDAFYDVRCKIFAKIKGAFKDKGVGQLFIKKSEVGKPYVVVRADNSLGTILLNILLQKDLPLQPKGKDIITCDPVGEDGKPMTIIIRLKNNDVASELLNKLKEFKDEQQQGS